MKVRDRVPGGSSQLVEILTLCQTRKLEPPVIGEPDGLEHRYPRFTISTLTFWPHTRASIVDRDRGRWWQPPGQGSQGYWW